MDEKPAPLTIGKVVWRGNSIDVLNPLKMEFVDKQHLKRVSGMAPPVALNALGDFDPDAWLGVLLVSILKVDPRVTQAALMKGHVVDDIIETFEVNPDFLPEGYEDEGDGAAAVPTEADVEAGSDHPSPSMEDPTPATTGAP